MHNCHSTGRVEDLGDLFVSVTGDDSVTDSQTASSSDRELPPDRPVPVADGLEDALAGAEVTEPMDPAE